MNEPLDHNPSKPAQKPVFSYMALQLAFIIVVLVIVNIMVSPVDNSIGSMCEGLTWPEKGIKYSFILGISFTIFAFTSKEKPKLKWSALGAMLLASLVFLGMLYYFKKMAGG